MACLLAGLQVLAAIPGSAAAAATTNAAQTGDTVAGVSGTAPTSATISTGTVTLDAAGHVPLAGIQRDGHREAISVPILDAVRAIGQMADAASETGNTRVQALAAATAAMSAKAAIDSASQVAKDGVGFKVTLSLGSTQTESQSTNTSSTLQDTSSYDSKQTSSGVGVSLCIPPFCYGASTASANTGKAQVQGDFASVTEQSGIKAGDGGYQVNVVGTTDLKGGVISSTDQAKQDGNNSLVTAALTQSDIQNRDVYDASSYSIGASFSGKMGDQTTAVTQADRNAAEAATKPGGSAGIGSASGSQGSITKSGISAGTLTITDSARQQELTGATAAETLAATNREVTTGQDTSAAITQAWSGTQLMADVQAQTQITAAFGSAAAKQVGDYATQKYKDALANSDPVEAAKWAEGGEYRIALHTGVGLLAGGLPGAAGAATSAAVMPAIGKAITDMNVPEPVKQALGAVAAATIGAAVGGVAGAAAGVNIDLNNRQLHPTETQRIKQLAAGDPQQEARLTAAACALVHCADGVPKDDANYAFLKALQTTGETMTAEKTLLSQQTGWEGRTSGPLFQYTGVDQYLVDPATQNRVGTRLVGAVQAGAGIVGAATSGALCTTGIGCLAAGITGTVSADYAIAGTVQAVTGQATTPLGEQVLQSLGMSAGAAALTYAALGIVPVGVVALPVKAVTAAGGVKEAVGADGVANTVSGARLTMQLSAEQAAGTRAPTAITSYSEHAAAQIASRDGGIGVSPAAVDDAFVNPVNIQYVPSKFGPTFKYTGQNATVVVNAQGNVVTAWGTSSAGVAK